MEGKESLLKTKQTKRHRLSVKGREKGEELNHMEITHACVLPWMQDAEGKSQLDTSLSDCRVGSSRESCRIKVPSIPTLSSGSLGPLTFSLGTDLNSIP